MRFYGWFFQHLNQLSHSSLPLVRLLLTHKPNRITQLTLITHSLVYLSHQCVSQLLEPLSAMAALFPDLHRPGTLAP